MLKYNALIIEDEMDNINLLKHYLKVYCSNINVQGFATTLDEAVKATKRLNPEIIFLDVLLKNKNAFSLFDQIEDLKSEVILISSYKRFALKAIKYRVLDYLLKPIEIPQLIEATNKAVENINAKRRLQQLKDQEGYIGKNLEFLAIPSLTDIQFIKTSDIIYCQAEGRYTLFYLDGDKSKIACKNLGEYEKILRNSHFFRIHHQFLVNLNSIRKIDKSAGNYCELTNGKNLPISKRKQNDLNQFLHLR